MRNLIHFFRFALANKETMKDRKAIKYLKMVFDDYNENFQ